MAASSSGTYTARIVANSMQAQHTVHSPAQQSIWGPGGDYDTFEHRKGVENGGWVDEPIQGGV